MTNDRDTAQFATVRQIHASVKGQLPKSRHCDDGRRFVVRADEKPTAFLEVEAAISP
jgi:hypothetical protein